MFVSLAIPINSMCLPVQTIDSSEEEGDATINAAAKNVKVPSAIRGGHAGDEKSETLKNKKEKEKKPKAKAKGQKIEGLSVRVMRLRPAAERE